MMDPDPIMSALDLAHLASAGDKTVNPAVRYLIEACQGLVAEVRDLQDELRTYKRRSAPALSAASMHIPIGGGDSFWRRQQARKREEQRAAAQARLAELRAKNETEMYDRLVEMPDGTVRVEPPKRVQRKRSRKTTMRK